MSTQNAKRMTTWMRFTYMGHSHGQSFRQETAPLIGLHLPMGFKDELRSASAKAAAIVLGTASNGGLPRYARERYIRTRRL
jgi:hypothetical protein